MEKLNTEPNWADIQAAHQAIVPYVHRTPVLTNQNINKLTGCQVYFKCENFQKVGAFKIRGATCALLALTEEERKKGVATDSSGNHAQGIALASKKLGIKAHIVMPQNTPSIKLNAVKDYGANIIRSGNHPDDREKMVEQVVADTGAIYIPSYNHYNIIAGQATAAKELIEEVRILDVLMAPIGGGGLMSGTAISTKNMLPNAQIIGTEPLGANDAYLSLQAGTIVPNQTVNTIADGLRTNLKDKTFGIISKYVEEIITVTEQEIIGAMHLIWERMKIIVEPSSAVPLAALLKQKKRFKNKKIGIILSGGNVDLKNLPF
ncbi:MAG: threonine/serine dehydratase [Aureispira sp.]|nr:threonine/serine dehydratase [Aureispira sp.]